ncbi:iron complex outermembrane recepter protein [Cnuella takakiae]|uniref:Iron complex outermembrane recepter protein n=1 Tax=Cnuella takakiae TaxID=1302690 RepID=A0A1M5H6V9_9BACT|nr:SusC/RagA family TonB-linked outer membrane protein [Cnuella takakiae]OLY91091.1 hypothetical protein BUE76_03625 [Cnuella takakiae]SHG11633.1 iron complex outermembrane recepter protein [Cnuella takakiae]
MNFKRLLAAVGLFVLTLVYALPANAQTRTVTGRITDSRGQGIAGVSVVAKGTAVGTQTDANGNYSLSVPENAKSLSITAVGYGEQDLPISGSAVNVTLETAAANLNEVVVVGYGTQRRKDVTGSIATVTSKDFNKGVQVSPDQLIQGKVAGVQILNNSGQPGAAVSVRIRGASSVRTGNQPLFVVDGVPLSGNSARPGFDAPGGLGGTPEGNPLNFINPNDIASIDVLKDASAAAIYGSRAANGVVLITTKRGQSGAPKIDFSVSAGVSNMLRQIDVLDGNEYRAALQTYGISNANNYGANVDAMDEITRSAGVQNYNVAVGGGNESGRYRLSLGYLDQKGIVIGSGLKRMVSNFNGGFKFLESKRLGLDFNIIASQQREDLAPVTSSAGFEGSLIGQALQWNPTRPLRKADGSLNLNYTATDGFPATAYNPLATSEFYSDKAKVTSILASVTPYFKITNDLEYRMILGLNYGTGIRRSQVSNQSEVNAVRTNGGQAYYSNNETMSSQLTHTLNYTKEISDKLNLTALVGYEFQRFDAQGVNLNGIGFTSNARPYTNVFQGSSRTQRNFGSFADPTVELQSYFARANVNINDRFILTGTFRADGSNKFGGNNKYGYFPAFAGAWNIGNEDFVKGSFFNNLKLRAGWGRTGNQEFPAGAALDVFEYTGEGNGAIRQANVGNPDLKWETTTTTNVAVDFGILRNRLSGSLEYFFRRTDDLLFNFEAIPPAPAARYWSNLPFGYVQNSGIEFSLNGSVVNKSDFNVDLGVNVSFLQNRLKDFANATGGNRLLIQTGAISGQGLTGAFAQQFLNDRPLYSYSLAHYLGLDRDGNAQFEGGDANDPANRRYAGSPNPTTLLGFTANVGYKKFSFTANMNGALGHYIYNNTTQAALAIGNIGGNRNVANSVYNPAQLENRANSQPVSDRYLEKGDYFKMANATLGYNVGNIGKLFRGVNVFVTGQNLFVITNYSGFDPEVNSPRPINDVPSFGIEYTPYPSARTFTIGANFSL